MKWMGRVSTAGEEQKEWAKRPGDHFNRVEKASPRALCSLAAYCPVASQRERKNQFLTFAMMNRRCQTKRVASAQELAVSAA